MTEDIVTTVNNSEMEEGMLDGIQCNNRHHESMLSNLYANEVGHNNHDSYASDGDWNKKDRYEY